MRLNWEGLTPTTLFNASWIEAKEKPSVCHVCICAACWPKAALPFLFLMGSGVPAVALSLDVALVGVANAPFDFTTIAPCPVLP